jgi:hypothetical protein
MNLKQTLLEEHSKKQCDKIVNWIGDDNNRFKELIQLFLNGEYRVVQRAAWPMSYSAQNHPEWVQPFYSEFLRRLEKKGEQDAVRRNIVRILQEIDVPKKYHGRLMNICFELIQSNDVAVAIKAFSLTILQNLSKQYPEIIPELKLIIEERWGIETAAFRSRAKKILGTRKHSK